MPVAARRLTLRGPKTGLPPPARSFYDPAIHFRAATPARLRP